MYAIGVHRNQFFKVLAGTGADLLRHILSYVTLFAARQADISSHQGESSQMLE